MTGPAGGIVVAAAERAAMEEAARAAYPEECCGVLLGRTEGGRRRVSAVLSIPNARRDAARNRYLIGAAEMLDAQRAARRDGAEVVGFFHSHPDVPPVPSATDLREATWPNISYVILSVDGGRVAEMRSWTLAEDRSAMEEEPILEAKGDRRACP